MPIVGPTRTPEPTSRPTETENPNPDACKKHCHYPTFKTGRISAGSDVVQGCPCMENRRDCDFERGERGRGICRNCHHASSLTVMASDCRLDF